MSQKRGGESKIEEGVKRREGGRVRVKWRVRKSRTERVGEIDCEKVRERKKY
jgi:hypothetical protein